MLVIGPKQRCYYYLPPFTVKRGAYISAVITDGWISAFMIPWSHNPSITDDEKWEGCHHDTTARTMSGRWYRRSGKVPNKNQYTNKKLQHRQKIDPWIQRREFWVPSSDNWNFSRMLFMLFLLLGGHFFCTKPGLVWWISKITSPTWVTKSIFFWNNLVVVS